MKIAILLPTIGNSGGVSVVYNLAKKLSERGNEVDIIRPIIIPNVKGWRFRDLKETMKLLAWIPLNLLNYNINKYRNPKVGMRKILSLKYLPTDYDSYIATWWETAYYLNKIENVDKYYLVQGYEIWNGNKELVEETYNYNDFKIFTISEYLKSIIENYTTNEVQIIYNEIQMHKFTRTSSLKEKSSIGIIYRSNKIKGFDMFINYLDKYRNERLKYYCIGREIPEKYHEKFDQIFDGNSLDEMELFYNKISLLVLPSETEGFGLPIVEAMLCGTIVAVKKVGIAYELLQDGINSIIMDNNLPEDINKAINYYLSLTPNELNIIGNNAFKTITKDYNIKAVKSQEKFYNLFSSEEQ